MQSRNTRVFISCALLAATSLAAGCKRSSTAPPPPNPVASTSPRTEAAPEFIKAAHDITAAAMSGDPEAIDRVIDMDALLNATIAGVRFSKADHDAFVSDMKARGLGELFGAMRKGKGNYRVLKVFVQDGKTQAICRLITGSRFNYHDWILQREPDGAVRATDVYIAMSGEYLSQGLHRLCVMAAAAADTGIMSSLAGTDRAILDHASDVQKIATALTNHDFQEALDIYNRLPPSLQREKYFFLGRLMASQNLREAHPGMYSKAIADYEKAFPGDPSLDMVSLDAFLIAKDYPALRRSIDRLDHWTGGDPYLDALRGHCDMLAGDPASMKRAAAEFQEAIKREPTLAEAYWGLVTLSLKQKDFSTTAATLTHIRRDLHIPLKDLTQVPMFAEFVKSDAYKQWIATTPGN